MAIELIAYLIMLICTINDIVITGASEVNRAIDHIENYTKGMYNSQNSRLSNNLKCFWKRVTSKSFKLIDKAEFIWGWRGDNTECRDSIERLIYDSKNFVHEDELFFRIDQYREEIIAELIKQNVLVASSWKKNRLTDDLSRSKSKAFCTVKAIAVLISHSNAIWFLAHQALHLISNLDKYGIGNAAVQHSLNTILKDEECIYKNFSIYMIQTSNGYSVNSEVIKMVSKHTKSLSGLIEVIEEKSKWLIIKDSDITEVPAKEEMIMNTRIGVEQDENEYDSPEFYRLSRYESVKMIAQMILVAEDIGKLNYLNFPEYISDLEKWGVDIAPFFESEEYYSKASMYFINEVAGGSLTKDCVWPLAKMPDNIAMEPEKYFKECIIPVAVALDKEHDSNNLDLYTALGKH